MLWLLLPMVAMSSTLLQITGGCTDSTQHCAVWASRGECEGNWNSDWMKVNCKKSCKQCNGDGNDDNSNDENDDNNDNIGTTVSPQLWTGGVVPYTIAPEYNEDEKNLILSGMRDIENKVNTPGKATCIRFVPHNDQNDYIEILPNNACRSKTGRVRGTKGQELSLGDRCMYIGTIVHELTHALGLDHEHTRSDRNEYIDIHWSNIQSDHKQNFHLRAMTLNTSYDYGSLMHYLPWDYAIDQSLPTWSAKKPVPWGVKFGIRDGYSKGDVIKVQRLYGCHEDSSRVNENYPHYCRMDSLSPCTLKNVDTDDFDWEYDQKINKASTPEGQKIGQARLETSFDTSDAEQICVKCYIYMKGTHSTLIVEVTSDKGIQIEKQTFVNTGYILTKSVDITTEVEAHSNVTVSFTGQPRGDGGIVRLYNSAEIKKGSCE